MSTVSSIRFASLASAAVLLGGCQAANNYHHGTHYGSGHAAGGVTDPRLASPSPDQQAARALDLSALSHLEDIIPKLTERRVVYVGESHDRYDHHLNQLAVIKGLYEADPNLAIGMEFFQQPFQSHLDDYVAGVTDERELLERTEWYERWKFDYRLYRPILEFAREKGIPVIALNIAEEITSKVSAHGAEALNDEERAQMPEDIDYSDTAYRERLEAIFSHHPTGHTGQDNQFDRFVDVQLLWDESMAERASDYLLQHPERRLVILAGSGHLLYRSGIPNRVERRTGLESYVVLNGDVSTIGMDPGIGDFLLMATARSLPPAGRLGAMLETDEEGVWIRSFLGRSAGEAAGMKEGDRVIAVNGNEVGRYTDIKLALWDKEPGDEVRVRLLRDHWLLADEEVEFVVTLR